MKDKIRNANANEVARARTANIDLGMGQSATFTAGQQIETSNKRAKTGLVEQDKIIAELTSQQKFLESTITSKGIVGGLIPEGDKTDKLNEVQKILEKLKNTLTGLDNQLGIGFISQDLFDENKLKAYNSALDELSRLGMKGADAFKQLSAEQKKLFDASFAKKMALANKDEFIPPPTEKAKNQATPRYINGVPQFADDFNKQQTESGVKYQEALRKRKEADELEKYTMQLNSAIKLTDQLSAVFNSAMANGQNFGEVFSNVLSGILVQLEQAVIKAALFSAIFSLVTGGAGDASAALGGSKGGGFFGVLGKMLGFADGGVVSGPASGYPVMLHGTEAVLNGSQMANLFHNMANTRMNPVGMQNGISFPEYLPAQEIRGDKLLLWYKQATFSQGLRTGR